VDKLQTLGKPLRVYGSKSPQIFSLGASYFQSRFPTFEAEKTVSNIPSVQIQRVAYKSAVFIHHFHIHFITLGIIGFPKELRMAVILGTNQPHARRPPLNNGEDQRFPGIRLLPELRLIWVNYFKIISKLELRYATKESEPEAIPETV
jgi:hypothetical protein